MSAGRGALQKKTSPIPLFTSDDWDPFELGLLNVYGSLEQPPYCGRGRKPHPILVPPEDLRYAQVIKKVAKGQVVKEFLRVVFGDAEEILRFFWADSGGCINTAYYRTDQSYDQKFFSKIYTQRNEL